MIGGAPRVVVGGVAAASLAVAAGLAALTPARAAPVEHVISAEIAMDAVRGAMANCKASGFNVAVAVVDRRGSTVAVAMMPDANPIVFELSQRKARSAAMFKTRSAQLGAAFAATPAYGQAMRDLDPRVSGAGGGVPLKIGAEFVGAVGVSGAPSPDQDEVCANAGAAAIAGALQ